VKENKNGRMNAICEK